VTDNGVDTEGKYARRWTRSVVNEVEGKRLDEQGRVITIFNSRRIFYTFSTCVKPLKDNGERSFMLIHPNLGTGQ
jgi:hypothetical protein